MSEDSSAEGVARPAEAIVDEYELWEVSDHGFFRELSGRHVDYEALWLLMANLQYGISSHFVRWLARLIERVDDLRIASVAAKQLNDELGNGDCNEMHSVLLERFVAGLEACFTRDHSRDWLQPGRGLLSAMTTVFSASEPYEGVGALMVSEIFAKKMDRCLGAEIRRQNALSRETLRWLDLHEQLEVDHAADSYEIAVLVPDHGPQLAAVWRGARAQWEALWGFLDEVQALADRR